VKASAPSAAQKGLPRPTSQIPTRCARASHERDGSPEFAFGRDALARTRAAWKPDPARGRVNLPTSPSGKGIREARDRLGGDADRGLLLLYTLTPYKGKAKTPENIIVPGWEKPIMAFAIAFPSAEHGIRVEYEVNLLYWMQEYGPSE